MLTSKQHRLLLFIHDRLTATGVAPSFEEMKEALGLRSKSGVHRLIGALEERQFLRRLPNRARALDVLRLPDDLHEAGPMLTNPTANGPATAGPAAIVDLAAVRQARRSAAAKETLIPLVGRIAAGLPIEAIEEHEQLAIPAALLGGGTHYALQVVGDSMIEAGIFDGDFALIRTADDADDGQIVVALVDGVEATLKYLHHEAGKIRLDPANRAYAPQYYPPSRVRIQGTLAGLLRRY